MSLSVTSIVTQDTVVRQRSVGEDDTGRSQIETSRTNLYHGRGRTISDVVEVEPDPELALPKRSSLVIIICANILLQMSFFIPVSSSNEYAHHLGGDSTFSGVVLGIPTVFSGLVLIPMMKYDGGGYKLPLHVSCGASIVGHILYALAYRANWLYLILLGRIVSGFAFSMFMYCKRYCSDPRLVGVRRRTTLASWLVIGQGIGLSLGPFAGGLLYKVGFPNAVFNGLTSPGWVMACVWAVFWVFVALFYEDVAPKETANIPLQDVTSASSSTTIAPIPMAVTRHVNAARDAAGSTAVYTAPTVTTNIPSPEVQTGASPVQTSHRIMSPEQWGVSFTMCWFAMLCFFILGGWEANIPVFSSSQIPFNWSPFAAGNFIALGGIATFPFLISNLILAPRIQDRKILAFGSSVGFVGLVLFLAILAADKHPTSSSIINFGSFFVCWWAVALGFNIATTVTVSLLSKQLPPEWNGWTSLAIQYSNYTGRVTGAIWGGSGVKVGMKNYVGLEIALVGIGFLAFTFLWRDLKAKKG